MEIVINLPDEYTERLNALVNAMSDYSAKQNYKMKWTLDAVVMVAALRGIEAMESSYLGRNDV